MKIPSNSSWHFNLSHCIISNPRCWSREPKLKSVTIPILFELTVSIGLTHHTLFIVHLKSVAQMELHKHKIHLLQMFIFGCVDNHTHCHFWNPINNLLTCWQVNKLYWIHISHSTKSKIMWLSLWLRWKYPSSRYISSFKYWYLVALSTKHNFILPL